MALPWRRRSRRDKPTDKNTSERRFQPGDRRLQRSKHEQDTQRQRLFIVAAVLIVLAILVIPGYGYYKSFVAPPRVLVAQIRDTKLTAGDLLQRLRLQQGLNRSSGQNLDLSSLPFEYLLRMTADEIIRQEAPNLGITVTEADIEADLRASFYPTSSVGEETGADQLEQEYKETYTNYLTAGQLSDEDFRDLVEADLYRDKVREELGKQIPAVEEQVEVHWIKFPSNPESEINPAVIKERLNGGEDFSAVAKEAYGVSRYADEDGYVGWIPRNAFPDLDPYFFGDANTEPLPQGQVSDVISVREGTYIVKVAGGVEIREISELMRERMKDVVLETWAQGLQQVGASEGWLELKFNSENYAWVAKQVRESAPRTEPNPGPR